MLQAGKRLHREDFQGLCRKDAVDLMKTLLVDRGYIRALRHLVRDNEFALEAMGFRIRRLVRDGFFESTIHITDLSGNEDILVCAASNGKQMQKIANILKGQGRKEFAQRCYVEAIHLSMPYVEEDMDEYGRIVVEIAVQELNNPEIAKRLLKNAMINCILDGKFDEVARIAIIVSDKELRAACERKDAERALWLLISISDDQTIRLPILPTRV